ncbi:MAG: LamG domain-containing protein [Minisyncoccia bacterium]
MKKGFVRSFLKDQSGQSLMEIIVGLTIGAVLIGTASIGIAFVLRSTSTNQNLATASQLTQGLLSNVQTLANPNWQNIYGLSKSSSTQYFLNASGTSYIAVKGQEGMIDNDVTNGLLGEWKLDESTGTVAYDATGNKYNGTLVSGPTRATSTCKIANCLNFDGSTNYVDVGVNFPQTTQRTYTWWHYISANGSAVFPIPLSHGGYSDGIRVLWRDDTDDMVDVQITTGSDTVPTLILQSPSVDQVGVWYYYAVTYDGLTTGKLYRNGVLVDTKTNGTGAIKATASHLYIGKGQYLWKGSIDDVRIYNRVLSASEVAQLYNTQPFTRYFYVDNVCRTNDSSGSIASSSSPCSGGSVDDPLTQKATAVTVWTAGGASPDQVSLARYITRWGNFSIRQTDWSGGTGQEGPITTPNSSYSSSTNITGTSTLGSFQIQNLSQQ